MYTIKKGVPTSTKTRSSKYPFSLMKKDTFFEVPPTDKNAVRNSSGGCAVASSAHSYAKRHNVKFETQRQPNGAMRIYRVV